MRIRMLFLGTAVVLFGLFGWAGAASAQEEPEIEHDAEECIHILEEGGDVDECHEAPSPILPATDELIWGALSFTILMFLMYRLAWPALKKAMEGRTERISQSLDEAEQAKQQAQSVLDDYQRQLADARNESARIIEETRQTADQLRRDLQERADADIAEMRRRASEEIQAAKDRAMSEVRAQVTELAIGAAERVVQRNLDRETNRALVESYIEQVGSR